MSDKNVVIGLVVVVVITIVGFMLYNYQQAQAMAALRAQQGGPVRQILGGVGGLVDGLIS